MNISGPFIRRPIATSLIAAALFGLGLISYFRLPVAALPQVDAPTIQINVNLPGASPETMASNVATPLERQLSLITGITQMTSNSTLGSTSITLQFDLARKHRRCRAGRAVGDQRRRRPAPQQPAQPADPAQGQPR